ncbi:Vitamin B12-binding protein [Austwickia sp. TVS 96-490-7B]|uniref:ABC transporter substrate-binding protein n=1 Tax=Austwickia sp. TVS 96-490-7B TaxID=2830843 RepID=UPI001C59A9A9|nr:ABC transporter substrate-binding protein [Austwickia sp. TVS 96-490-7B]MBW3085616.1 Vitamin B12-binding protein [Austwickia sp. TVS 96-490-7B]
MSTARASRRTATALALIAGLAMTTSCGATVADNAGGSSSTAAEVQVQRCGETVTYRDPRKVIAYEGGSADKMFALGLTDRVLGYVMTPTNPDPATSPYAADYAKVPLLSSDLLNKELVVDKKADMVIAGWNSGFSEKRGITPKILDGLGIASFMHTESCFAYPGHPETMKPLPALYADFERLGKIFHVEDRATAKVNEFKDRMDKVRKTGSELPSKPKVFLYDSGTDQPATAGNQVPVQEIIDAAGGTNIYADLNQRWTKTSWESVVKADPDVIMIMSYRDKPAEEKIAALKANPALAKVAAVKNDKFYVIDYNECISGPRNIDGAEKFGAWLAKNHN